MSAHHVCPLVHQTVDGLLILEWPDGFDSRTSPLTVEVTPELLVEIVAELNEHRRAKKAT